MRPHLGKNYRTMHLLNAVLLGIIQGLTEFLPISSSGHLALMQRLMGFEEPALLFDTLLHLGTLIAVIIYFRGELVDIAGSIWGWIAYRRTDDKTRLALFLLAGTVPAAVIGSLFEGFFEDAFASPAIIGLMLLVTGAILGLSDMLSEGTVHLGGVGYKNALIIGLAQAAAIMPGLSRSGSTIAAGIWRGLKREEAATFSFLLSIPAIIGASGLQLFKNGFHALEPQIALAGVASAAVFGFIAIALLMRLVRARMLRLFSVYCFIVGSIAIASAIIAG